MIKQHYNDVNQFRINVQVGRLVQDCHTMNRQIGRVEHMLTCLIDGTKCLKYVLTQKQKQKQKTKVQSGIIHPEDRFNIGSSGLNDLQLNSVDANHSSISNNDNGEWVYTDYTTDESHGTKLLRNGNTVTLAPKTVKVLKNNDVLIFPDETQFKIRLPAPSPHSSQRVQLLP